MSERQTEKHEGIALRCGADAVVREVFGDGLGAAECVERGAPFADLVDAASRGKAAAFFAELRARRAAFGWEMNVACTNGRITPIIFAGAAAADAGAADESFFIVGAKSRRSLARVFDELVRVNRDEEADAVRAALADLSIEMRAGAERDSGHYDELSRLNNELATVQRELAKKNHELAALNEQKNQFLGIAAHDLRNPLSVIQSYSEFLLEEAGAALNEKQIGYIHKIYSSSAFMLNLVNDFLDYSKIEAGRLEIQRRRVDLAALIDRVAADYEKRAERKGVRIRIDAPAPVSGVLLDEPKIEQVVGNLLSNAVKFSPEGGEIRIALAAEAGEITLAVEDDGPGIAPGEAEKIFAPFVRGRGQVPNGEKSSGLGLAIVAKIVEGHGGRVRLVSARSSGSGGGGARFVVTLPRDGRNRND